MYRLAATLLQPSTLVIVSLIATVLFAWRRPKARGRAGVVIAVLATLLLVISTPAAGYLLMASLEQPYPKLTAGPGHADTIVILSGSIRVYDRSGEDAQVGSDTAERCLYGLRLYKQAGGCRMILSGGKVDPAVPGPSLSQAMRDFLVDLGANPADLIMEERSTTTYENALYSTEILEKHQVSRVFLVTDAVSMRRAIGCFQARGIEVVSAPSSHQAGLFIPSAKMFLPSAEGLYAVDAASHEWLGILWYWLRGRF